MDMNKNLLAEKAELVLNEAENLGASQAEVSINFTRSALTRLANSIIDQNVSENHFRITITVYLGKSKGAMNIEVPDDISIKNAVAKAVKLAKITPEDSHFVSLPSAKPFSNRLNLSELVSKNTLNVTPEQRAEAVTTVVNEAHDLDKRIKSVSGAISNNIEEKMIQNSLGVNAYQMRTAGNINLTILAENNEEETAGWSADSRIDFTNLEFSKVSSTAANKAIKGFGAKLIDPGMYEVVLEPAAIGGLTSLASIYGLSALMYQEFRSYLIDKIGEKVFSDRLNLWSDPLNPQIVHSTLFDGEGVPTRKLELIDNGVVKSLVYDTYTGNKDGVESTGHKARWWGDRQFPIPTHLFMKEGDSNIEEMIAETKKGILVTHFHYQNPVNPSKGVFTGLTRDGTWLIENGEVISPLKTLRYTDEVTRFFKEIDLIGKYSDVKDTCSSVLPGLFPPVKLRSFRFSGSQKQ